MQKSYGLQAWDFRRTWVYSRPLPVGMTRLLMCVDRFGSGHPSVRWPDISNLTRSSLNKKKYEFTKTWKKAKFDVLKGQTSGNVIFEHLKNCNVIQIGKIRHLAFWTPLPLALVAMSPIDAVTTLTATFIHDSHFFLTLVITSN